MSNFNSFNQVATYHDIMLATLQNENGILNKANKKFKDFPNTVISNLGPTVQIYKPVRVTGVNSLTWETQGISQRVQNLTINNAYSSSVDFTAQQMLENVDPFDFMEKIGDSMIADIGSNVEQNLASDFIKYPYRFYGDGISSLNTSYELAEAMALFHNYGSVKTMAEAFIPDLSVPSVVNSNANQFTLDRNNRDTMSWELGTFAKCNWNTSNQLQVHNSGSEGEAGSELTVVSTTKDANGNILTITFSGCSAPSDANSIKAYDRLYVTTSGSRLLQFTGYNVSSNPIQFQAASDASSTSGSQVTVTLLTPLFPGKSTTDSIAINRDIVAGMKVKVLPSHRTGVIYAGNPHMLAMPQMGPVSPFDSAYKADPDTGAAIQMAWGATLGQNSTKMGCSTLWGSTMFPEYAMALIYPV